jgi:peptidoglycan hydrolase-like protein with peptidoglycan-binding domain
VVLGLKYAFYVYAKLGSGDRKLALTIDGASNGAVFDLLAGTALTTSGGSALIQSQNNGYYLVTYLFEATSTGSVAADVRMQRNSTTGVDNYTGDSTSSVILWGAQLAEGSPSSYIPTAGTQVTKAVDGCVRTLGDEYNRSSFTLYIEAKVNSRSVYTSLPHLVKLTEPSGGLTPDISIRAEASGNKTLTLVLRGASSGTEVADFGSFGTYGTTFKVAIAVTPTQIVGYFNGVSSFALSGDFSSVLESVVNTLSLSSSGANITTKDLRMFPSALSEAELITLTGGT